MLRGTHLVGTLCGDEHQCRSEGLQVWMQGQNRPTLARMVPLPARLFAGAALMDAELLALLFVGTPRGTVQAVIRFVIH